MITIMHTYPPLSCRRRELRWQRLLGLFLMVAGMLLVAFFRGDEVASTASSGGSGGSVPANDTSAVAVQNDIVWPVSGGTAEQSPPAPIVSVRL